jgi:hypothetical protein
MTAITAYRRWPRACNVLVGEGVIPLVPTEADENIDLDLVYMEYGSPLHVYSGPESRRARPSIQGRVQPHAISIVAARQGECGNHTDFFWELLRVTARVNVGAMRGYVRL